jgi:uncharacterized small protein (DUF1192 family)
MRRLTQKLAMLEQEIERLRNPGNSGSSDAKSID